MRNWNQRQGEYLFYSELVTIPAGCAFTWIPYGTYAFCILLINYYSSLLSRG